MPARVAINGLGRIGRATLKIVQDEPGLELVAVNDIAPTDNLAYLLRYDTVYGRYPKEIEIAGEKLVVDGREIRVLSEKDPGKLPWDELGVDLVFECTGIFRQREECEKHLAAGARTVVLSAPGKGGDIPTIVHGVNHAEEGEAIFSCASCTTNCITPVVEVMGRRIGVRKAIMTTVHGYTSSQELVDGPSGKWRRGRAAAANLVPTSTGAAIATTKVLTELDGLFGGMAIRAPVPAGSISDIVFVTGRRTSVEEVNSIFEEEAETDRYRGVLGVARDPVVSSDILQDPRASIVDLDSTEVVDGDLVKILSWYDNEWGYAAQMVREAVHVTSR